MPTTISPHVTIQLTPIQRGPNDPQIVPLSEFEIDHGTFGLNLKGLPAGVTTDPVFPIMLNLPTHHDLPVTFTVADTAPLGHFPLQLTLDQLSGPSALPLHEHHMILDLDLEIVERINDFKLTLDQTALKLPRLTDKFPVTVTIARSGKFTGPVTISCTHYPAGVTVEPPSHVIPETQTTARLELTISRTAQLGHQFPSINIHGLASIDGKDVPHPRTIKLTVTPAAGDFTVQVNPSSCQIRQGDSQEVEVRVQRTGTFTGAVHVTGMAPGLTTKGCTIRAGEAAATCTIAAACTAKVGPTDLKLTAKGDGIFEAYPTNLAVTVTELPVWVDLKVALDTITMHRGQTRKVDVTVTRCACVSGKVTIICTNGHPGIETNLPLVIPASKTNGTITVTATLFAHTGMHRLNLQATADGVAKSGTDDLAITVYPYIN
jgi:hypothetical protein